MTDIFGFLLLSLQLAAPIAFAAIGGIFSKRVGVFNIGLEGIISMSTVAVVWGNLAIGNYLGGLSFAIGIGVAYTAIFAVLTISLKMNHLLAGLLLIFAASGLAPLMAGEIFGSYTLSPISNVQVPGLFGQRLDIVAMLTIPTAIIAWHLLYRTSFGLRLRAVGERPMVAESLGGRVSAMRYFGVLICGALCGLSAITIYPSQWLPDLVDGRGYLAIAVMLVAGWRPMRALGIAFFFGMIESLFIVDPGRIPISQEIIDSLPYLITLVVLAVSARIVHSPASEIESDRRGEKIFR